MNLLSLFDGMGCGMVAMIEEVITKAEKPIEPLLSTVIIEDKKNNCQIYCLGITQLIRV